MQYSYTDYGTMYSYSMRCDTTKHNSMIHNALQHSAMKCTINTMKPHKEIQHNAIDTTQCNEIHCVMYCTAQWN